MILFYIVVYEIMSYFCLVSYYGELRKKIDPCPKGLTSVSLLGDSDGCMRGFSSNTRSFEFDLPPAIQCSGRHIQNEIVVHFR